MPHIRYSVVSLNAACLQIESMSPCNVVTINVYTHTHTAGMHPLLWEWGVGMETNPGGLQGEYSKAGP